MTDLYTSLSTIIKLFLNGRGILTGLSNNGINTMIQELTPVIIDCLFITIDERKNPACHDNNPIGTAINIVIKHTMLDMLMLVLLKMKYSEISNNILTEEQEIWGDINSYNEAKERSVYDIFQTTLDKVYQTNHYLLVDDPCSKVEYYKYIEPIQNVLGNYTIKSANKK